MVNLIYMDGSGHKVARLVTNRETYCGMRNADENVKNFLCARGGDQKAKGRQLQFNYNDQLPDGVLKGCHHAASTFSHDIDCSSPEEQQRIKEKLLAMATELGLLELSGSANYGLHGVFRRELGKTIRENQVRIATLTETEMDTSAHDQPRVMYTGPATDDVLLYLDDAIFEEGLTEEESAKWLIVVKQQFGDLVNQSALNGAVAPIPAIFTLKANYGWRDDPEPEVQNNDGREDLTPDAIAAKWKDLPD